MKFVEEGMRLLTYYLRHLIFYFVIIKFLDWNQVAWLNGLIFFKASNEQTNLVEPSKWTNFFHHEKWTNLLHRATGPTFCITNTEPNKWTNFLHRTEQMNELSTPNRTNKRTFYTEPNKWTCLAEMNERNDEWNMIHEFFSLKLHYVLWPLWTVMAIWWLLRFLAYDEGTTKTWYELLLYYSGSA